MATRKPITKKNSKSKAKSTVMVSSRDCKVTGDLSEDFTTLMLDVSLPSSLKQLNRFPKSKRGTGRTLAIVKGEELIPGVFMHATIFTRNDTETEE
jgi:hypothetical protein